MNNFDSYMTMREDAIRYFNDQFKHIFDEAFGTIKSDFIFMFDHRYASNDKNGRLDIYTNRPGVLIGVAGKNIEKLKELLKEEFRHDYDVQIHEVGHYYMHKEMFADEANKPGETNDSEETVGDVLKTLNEKQKKVVIYLINQALKKSKRT